MVVVTVSIAMFAPAVAPIVFIVFPGAAGPLVAVFISRIRIAVVAVLRTIISMRTMVSIPMAVPMVSPFGRPVAAVVMAMFPVSLPVCTLALSFLCRQRLFEIVKAVHCNVIVAED